MMIVHIVMFKFKAANKHEHIAKAEQKLAALMGKVPTLLSIDVGVNFDTAERAMDLSIITRFKTVEDLQAYAIHPEHLSVVEFIKTVVEYSKVVDYHA